MPSAECCRFRLWDLYVNVSHIVELEAGAGVQNGLVQTAIICEKAGCDGISAQLGRGRSRVTDGDIFALKNAIEGKLNIEIGPSDEMVKIVEKIKPNRITLVPEKDDEITSGGGLDIGRHIHRIKAIVRLFHDQDIPVSLLIDPDSEMVQASKDCEADFIEFHCGRYRSATKKADIDIESGRICDAAIKAMNIGVKTGAGHGLTYRNITPVLFARALQEVHVGQAIFWRASSVGLSQAVDEMLDMLY